MKTGNHMRYWLFLLIAGLGLTMTVQAADPRKSGGFQGQGEGNMPESGALYRPPTRGAPAVRVGAGSRGINDGEEVPMLMVLAPDHIALSATDQPDLYWFISSTHPGNIELSISREDQIDPVLEVNLGPATEAGFHRVELAKQGVTLEPEVEYTWFVTLIVNPDIRSKDHTMGGAFMVEPLPLTIGATNPLDRAMALAQAGYWHDAIDTLGSAIAEDPSNSQLHETRAKLLDQVGLSAAAAYDRQNTPK